MIHKGEDGKIDSANLVASILPNIKGILPISFIVEQGNAFGAKIESDEFITIFCNCQKQASKISTKEVTERVHRLFDALGGGSVTEEPCAQYYHLRSKMTSVGSKVPGVACDKFFSKRVDRNGVVPVSFIDDEEVQTLLS